MFDRIIYITIFILNLGGFYYYSWNNPLNSFEPVLYLILAILTFCFFAVLELVEIKEVLKEDKDEYN